MQQLLLGILLLLTSGWLFVRIRRNKAEVIAEKSPKVTNPKVAFHAVSLKYSEDACRAAKEMTGRRFLSSTAPRLPLSGCSATECHCTFVHHNDRRNTGNRRSPFSATGRSSGSGTFERERRQQADRRGDTD